MQDGDVDEPSVGGKRRKRCTSNVWEYFTKKQMHIKLNAVSSVLVFVCVGV